MALRVGINGLGRIGRLAGRAVYELGKPVQVVAVNDGFKLDDAKFRDQVRQLMLFDSVHGRFPGTIKLNGDILEVNGNLIKVLHQMEIPNWKELGVDVVLECTGALRDSVKASQHLQAGAKKVIISAPAKDAVPTFVMGVNEETYDPANHHVVSNASCTTNCLAPMAKVLLEGPGIKRGWMTTIHAYTNDQNLVDGFHKEELARARAANLNMIPTKTGAAEAVGLVLPALKGRLTGAAIRVQGANVSAVDLSFNPESPMAIEQIKELLRNASAGKLAGILGYEKDFLISSYYNHDSRSSIVMDKEVKEIRDEDGQLVRVLSYYDNEWAYSVRMLDLALYMASKGL